MARQYKWRSAFGLRCLKDVWQLLGQSNYRRRGNAKKEGLSKKFWSSLRLLVAQWAATIYVGVVSLALSVFVARQMGPDVFGEYSAALAAGSILAIFIDGGMRNLLLRERVRASTIFAHFSEWLPAIALGHAIMVAFAASLIIPLLFENQMALALATVWCFFGVVLTQYVSALLRGDGRLVLDAGWQIGHRTFSAACIVLVIVLGFHSPWHILAAWALGAITVNLVFPRGMRCKPSFVLQPVLYKAALPLLWIDLATAVYFRSDMLMLEWFGVPQERVGQYAASYRLVEAVILFANPVAILLFRHMRQVKDDISALAQHILRTVALASILGLGGATLITAVAGPVISLTYGVKYPEAIGLLVILAWALVFVLPNAVLTQAALALNLERSYALAASIAAVCNIALNSIFITHYGPQAAAWTTIATEAMLMGVLAFVLIRTFRSRIFEVVTARNDGSGFAK